jgi:hypothetical protein
VLVEGTRGSAIEGTSGELGGVCEEASLTDVWAEVDWVLRSAKMTLKRLCSRAHNERRAVVVGDAGMVEATQWVEGHVSPSSFLYD